MFNLKTHTRNFRSYTINFYNDDVPNTSTSEVDADAIILQNNPSACLDFAEILSAFLEATWSVIANGDENPHSTNPGIKLVTGPIKNKLAEFLWMSSQSYLHIIVA